MGSCQARLSCAAQQDGADRPPSKRRGPGVRRWSVAKLDYFGHLTMQGHDIATLQTGDPRRGGRW